MKKPFIYVAAFLLALIFSAKPYHARATHGAAGEIVYEWISDSTYRFFFKFYRDCTGVLEPTSQPICFYNSCNSSSFVVQAQKWVGPNGNVVTPACLGVTKCTNPMSPLPGYREWIYAVIVTMPSQCADWKISTHIADRNPNVNLMNAAGTALYIETRMNNVGVLQGNNSPYFAIKPLPYMCVNWPTTFNNGAVDPDGDSLFTEVIMPQTSTGCNFPPSNSVFVAATPPYGIPNNPLQTNNTFVLQGTTGQMSLVPTMMGSAAISIRVKEYRNGILIGSVIRDLQAQVINCGTPPPAPTFTVLPGNQVFNGEAYGCPGLPLSFCFRATSTNSNAVLKVYTDNATSLPGSGTVYTGIGTDTVNGCINWTPPPGTYGNFTLNVVVVDSTCNGSLPSYHTFTIPVHIGKMPSITITAAPDTNIASGTPVTFTATTTNCNSGTYQWQKNGVDVSGATASTWTTNAIADMDIITCKLHCNDSCASVQDTVSNKITMHVFTSVKGAGTVRAASLYPNPNNGVFTLSGFAMSSASLQLEIVNAIGQVVWSAQQQVNAGTFNRTIDAGNISNGIYTLRLKTTGETQVLKMSVNK